MYNFQSPKEIREFHYSTANLLFGLNTGPRYHLKRRRTVVEVVLLLLYGQRSVVGHTRADQRQVVDFRAAGNANSKSRSPRPSSRQSTLLQELAESGF